MRKILCIKNILFISVFLLFWMLAPSGIASAQSLSISANPTKINKGQNSTITVTTSPAVSQLRIDFPGYSPKVGAVFGILRPDNFCITTNSGSCTVTFDSGHPTVQNNSTRTIFARASGYTDSSIITITIGNPVPAGATLVSTSSYTGVVNTPIQLQVRPSDNRPGVDITFRIQPDPPSGIVSFSPGNCRLPGPGNSNSICSECQTNSSGVCNASFTSTRAGTFNLQISTPSGPGFLSYGSITVPIIVTNPPITVTPPPVQPPNQSVYFPLAPLPDTQGGTMNSIDVGSGGSFGNYLNLTIIIVIGLAAVLAVIMIIWGGLEIMTESISHKNEGKKRITDAVLGLLLALCAYAILYTINPNLLNIFYDITPTQVTAVTGNVHTILANNTAICGQTQTLNLGGISATVTSCNPSEMVTINFMGHTIQVNQAVASEFSRVDFVWQNNTGPRYAVTSASGYNARMATNSNPAKPSAHAFGIAVDINATANPYNGANPPQCITDMTTSFVKYFTNVGFGWGGYWTSVKDPMHFSLLPNEIATSGTCSSLKP